MKYTTDLGKDTYLTLAKIRKFGVVDYDSQYKDWFIQCQEALRYFTVLKTMNLNVQVSSTFMSTQQLLTEANMNATNRTEYNMTRDYMLTSKSEVFDLSSKIYEMKRRNVVGTVFNKTLLYDDDNNSTVE